MVGSAILPELPSVLHEALMAFLTLQFGLLVKRVFGGRGSSEDDNHED